MIYTLIVCGLVGLVVLAGIIYIVVKINDAVEQQYSKYEKERKDIINEES